MLYFPIKWQILYRAVTRWQIIPPKSLPRFAIASQSALVQYVPRKINLILRNLHTTPVQFTVGRSGLLERPGVLDRSRRFTVLRADCVDWVRLSLAGTWSLIPTQSLLFICFLFLRPFESYRSSHTAVSSRNGHPIMNRSLVCSFLHGLHQHPHGTVHVLYSSKSSLSSNEQLDCASRTSAREKTCKHLRHILYSRFHTTSSLICA